MTVTSMNGKSMTSLGKKTKYIMEVIRQNMPIQQMKMMKKKPMIQNWNLIMSTTMRMTKKLKSKENSKNLEAKHRWSLMQMKNRRAKKTHISLLEIKIAALVHLTQAREVRESLNSMKMIRLSKISKDPLLRWLTFKLPKTLGQINL